MNYIMAILYNRFHVPLEIANHISEFANTRSHNNIVSCKFHPKDPRVRMLDMLFSMYELPVDWEDDTLMIMLRVTDNKYIVMRKLYNTTNPYYIYKYKVYELTSSIY
jgi:hypothetical protein